MGAREEHSDKSASASKRWLGCPASVQAIIDANLPDETSEAAEKGTLAHSMCELKLRKIFIEPGMSTRTYNSRLKKIRENPLFEPEMERNTDIYVDLIKDIAYGYSGTPFVAVEQKVDYGNYASGGFGTSDCIVICGSVMHIVDYKNGKGVPVTAEDNPQMKLYALGALNAYGFLYPINTCVLHIVQPNLNSITEWPINAGDLVAWGIDTVKPISDAIDNGTAEFHQGEWCDKSFCPLAATCRHRMEENMKLMGDAVDPITGDIRVASTISNEEIGEILKKAQFLASWVKKLESYALSSIVSGKVIPGWKCVEGRSNRDFISVDRTMELLIENGFDRSLLYNETPIKLTELEKLLTKEDFNKYVQPGVHKPKGKPTLVPADDRRPEYVQISTEEAFGGVNQYKQEE